MPNGYGLYKSSGTPAADESAIRKLVFTDTKSGTALVLAAQRAVQALARLRGIGLGGAAAASASSHSTSGQERLEIGIAVAAALLLGGALRLLRRRRRT
jgi:hypothetical protein